MASFNLFFFTMGRKEESDFRGDLAAAEASTRTAQLFLRSAANQAEARAQRKYREPKIRQEDAEDEDVRTGAVGTGDGTGSGDIIEHTTHGTGAVKEVEPFC